MQAVYSHTHEREMERDGERRERGGRVDDVSV